MKDVLAFESADDGIRIHVIQEATDIVEVSFDGRQGVLRYGKKVQFFRALGLFLEQFRKHGTFHIVESPRFTTSGVMVDCSRNAVPNVNSIKRLLRHMALMGLNLLMLYTEDTYEIEGLPYFGYMRGRFTHDELKDCDDYAARLGIEMVPCIQTLAHLVQALKWKAFSSVRDTGDILLVGDDKTYALVEKMIRSVSAPFRRKKIHVGMDEHIILSWKVLDYMGIAPVSAFYRAFDQVVEITGKLGLEPMIWSDMLFTFGSKTRSYLDGTAAIPEEALHAIPKSVRQVYWDYYHNDESFYIQYIRKHRELGVEPVFAGGVWTFAGNTVNHAKTFAATNAALSACKGRYP